MRLPERPEPSVGIAAGGWACLDILLAGLIALGVGLFLLMLLLGSW